MKHRAPRALASAVTAALLALLIVAGGPTGPAAAATIPLVDPSLPVGPLNQLPSTATGAAAKLTGSPLANQVLYETYKMSRDPEFWKAVEAQQRLSSTPAQDAIVAARAKPQVPATAIGPLSKLVGGTMQVFGTYQFGAMAGNKIAELTGIDKTGNVCRISRTIGDVPGAAFALAAGAICDPSGPGEHYTSNSDGVGGYHGGSSCNDKGECAALTHEVTVRLSDTVNRYYQCFTITNVISGASPISYGFTEPGGGASGGDLQQTSPWSENNVCGTDKGTYARSWQDNIPSARMVAWWLTRLNGTSPQVARPGVGDADPWRHLITKIIGTDGKPYTTTSAPYKESQTDWAKPEMPLLPDGVGVESMTITEEGGPRPAEVYNEPATPEYKYQRDLAPECSTGTCLLDLQKTGVSCFQTPGPCADWFADPNKTSTYKCVYGGHDVALSQCNVYAPTFKPEAKTSGAPLGNPTTGEPMTNPNPTPGIGTSISPSTGKAENCLANGWATAPNPIEWVMVPVKCAIQWAFVPRPEVVSGKLDTIKKSWQATTPGAVVTAVSGFALTAPESSCSGITVPMGWLMGIPDMKVFNACPGELMAPIAGVAKLVFYVIFTVVGIGGVTSNVGRIFGYRGVGAE